MSDVLVVGGGPAGSTVAGLLAGRGWEVRVLDRARFPRPKACGECLNPGAVDALERLGLLGAVLGAAAPSSLRGWRIRSGGGAEAAADFGGGRTGLGIAREVLDHALLAEAVRRGARVEEEVTVRRLASSADGRGLRLDTREPDGAEGHRVARLVVGADGLRSVVARHLGVHPRPPRLHKVSLSARIEGRGPDRGGGLLVIGEGRTVGLAPVSAAGPLWNATVVVTGAARARELAAGREAFFERAVREAEPGWEGGFRVAGPLLASGPFDWPVRRCAAPGVVLVGDAAGYFDPLTGQGIYRALRSAEWAAAAIDSTLRGGGVWGRHLREYDDTVRRAFGPGRRVQRLVEEALSRPRLRRWSLSRLAARPAAFRALIRVTGDVDRPRSLLAPEFWTAFLPGT